jgi:hypothetical protein
VFCGKVTQRGKRRHEKDFIFAFAFFPVPALKFSGKVPTTQTTV